MLGQDSLKQIGIVAKESGIPIQTIRYYEEIGLLKASSRSRSGYRLFKSDVFSRLNFIKRSQKLGLSLLEIKEFLAVYDQGQLPCDRVTVKLQEKITEIEHQIKQLHLLKGELENLLSSQNANSNSSDTTICPIIEQNFNQREQL